MFPLIDGASAPLPRALGAGLDPGPGKAPPPSQVTAPSRPVLRVIDCRDEPPLDLRDMLPEESPAEPPLSEGADLTPHPLACATQKVVDLIAGNDPALRQALGSIAGPSHPLSDYRASVQGGMAGGATKSDSPAHPAGKLPPATGYRLLFPVRDELAAPMAPRDVPDATVFELPAPPTPPSLIGAIDEALATPWSPDEGGRYAAEVELRVELPALKRAEQLRPELERFFGGRLPALSRATESGSKARGAARACAVEAQVVYLVRLADTYAQFKHEFYGLLLARRARLSARSREASAWEVVDDEVEDELREYLFAKYQRSLRSLMWRAMRSHSAPRRTERPPGESRFAAGV